MAAGVDWPQQQQQQMLMESGLGYSGEPPLPFVQQEWHARVLEFMAGEPNGAYKGLCLQPFWVCVSQSVREGEGTLCTLLPARFAQVRRYVLINIRRHTTCAGVCIVLQVSWLQATASQQSNRQQHQQQRQPKAKAPPPAARARENSSSSSSSHPLKQQQQQQSRLPTAASAAAVSWSLCCTACSSCYHSCGDPQGSTSWQQ
jgi:hypothetical protein